MSNRQPALLTGRSLSAKLTSPYHPLAKGAAVDSREHLRREMTGFMQSSILAAMAELDLGTAILEHGNRAGRAALARLLECDPRGLEALLDALASMEYLVKHGAGETAEYSVADAYRELLDSRHSATFIPIMRHMACVMRGWTRLTWAVKYGRPQERPASILGPEQDRVSFIMGMNSVAVSLVDGTMRSLREAGILPLGKADARILDIGGASGTYTQAFLEALPEARATIFDLPVGIEQARKRFTGTALEERVTLVEGDFTRDELPAGHDFAWISAIIHQMNRQNSRDLYGKTRRALNPGAMVAVRDYVMSPDRTAPVDGAFFGINMLANTERGMVYTFDEIREDLEQAGFASVSLAVPALSMSAVVVAHKDG